MLFVNPFLLFGLLPVSLLLFYATRRRFGPFWALIVVVAASATFYWPYGPRASAILAGSLMVNLSIGALLVSLSHQHEALRRLLLIAGLIFNFVLLIIVKYLAAFFDADQMAIPAGISFYTFHQAVFLVDAHSRRSDVTQFVPPISGPRALTVASMRYAAFVAFFPQLVIGPITYLRELGPQILSKRFGKLKLIDLQVGTTLIVVGLFKKLCIADPIGATVDLIYGAISVGQAISSGQAAYAVLGYFFQLYFDFSGYSDMALGIARLFGLRLPQNFDSPLRANGVVDFYRRWHITLSRVIALFLFTPLAMWGARKALDLGARGWKGRALSTWLPAFANFQVIALWHAALPTFVLFGAIHAMWFIIETEVKSSKWFKRIRSQTSDKARQVMGCTVTILILLATFTLFRSPDLSTFGEMMSSLIPRGRAGNPMAPVGTRAWLILLVAGVVVFLLPNIYWLLRFYRPSISTYNNDDTTPVMVTPLKWRPTIGWSLVITAMAVACFLRLNYPTPFLYAGF